MSLTDKQIYDLNNMNVAAQNIQLGTKINEQSGSIVSISGSIVSISNSITEISGSVVSHTSEISTISGSVVEISGSIVTISNSITEISGSFTNLKDMSQQSASAVEITGGYINGIKYGTATDYSEFEADGTLIFSGSATTWNDIFFPLTTARRGANNFPVFSETEVAYVFPSSDTSHIMYMVGQMPHDRKVGSDISPHVHWKQTQSGSPVFKLDYKWFGIGQDISATWNTLVMDKRVIPYTSGSVHQLNYGDMISGSIVDPTVGVSSIIIMKLYRDDNAYAGNAVAYQFDIHYQQDSVGSRTEYSK